MNPPLTKYENFRQNPNQTAEIVYFLTERDSQITIREDKSLCISLSRKGEFPIKLITPTMSNTFLAFS
jgi:hypothetical protein